MSTAAAASPASGWQGGWTHGLKYGALGLPLAFVALPLYVVLPSHYATEFGIPLATLGALLLGARLFDAVADPWIGRLVDGWFARSAARVLAIAAGAAVVLALGFRGLFFPAVDGQQALLWWCAALLGITYLGYSVLSVLHQAWGARLGGRRSAACARWCRGARAWRWWVCWWPACCPRWPGCRWPASCLPSRWPRAWRCWPWRPGH